jgi:RNA polymerase sigma-54 factor
MLQQPDRIGEETRQYIIERLNDARWLINSIEQRRSTILKVANYILNAQRDFFEHGVSHLRPMILQEVADAVGLHVATISRVTNGKYMQTPYGVFELKYFFDGKVGLSSGEDVATRTVKEKIRQLISGEDPRNPLNDERITKILNAEGIDIARRTVAKYRERLNINPVRYRKKV